MSLPTRSQAFSFLEPLRGRSVSFIVSNRKSNVLLSRFLLGCLATLRFEVNLLDTSCFYSLNARELTRGLPKDFVQTATTLHYLSDDHGYAGSLSDVFSWGDVLSHSPYPFRASAIMIDDTNALFYLLSSQGQRFGIHRLSALYHMISYRARLYQSIAIGTVYGAPRGGTVSRNTQRSLSRVSDLQVMTQVDPGGELVFRCGGIPEWPDEGFRAASLL